MGSKVEKAEADCDTFLTNCTAEFEIAYKYVNLCPLYHFEIMKTFGYCQEELAASCLVREDAFCNHFTHLPLYGLTEEQFIYMADAVLAFDRGNTAGRIILATPVMASAACRNLDSGLLSRRFLQLHLLQNTSANGTFSFANIVEKR